LEIRKLLSHLRVGDVMRTDVPRVSPDDTVEDLVEDRLLRTGERCFFVSDREGRLLGLVTLHEVKRLSRESWPTTLLRDVMLPFDQLRMTGPEHPLVDALEIMSEGGVNQLPVVEGSSLLGVVSREDLLRRVTVQLELGSERS